MSTSITRRRLLAAGVAASSLALSGCFTRALYENHDEPYVEHVSAFMITKDGKKLVVLGERYHYIFDLPDKLRPVLAASYRKSLHTSFISFRADGSDVTGQYDTVLSKDAPDDERQAATADGFRNWRDRLELDGNVVGKRYSTEGFTLKPDGTAQPFNERYTVGIDEAPSAFAKGLRILATPVTVAADGVLVLGGVLLLPVAYFSFKDRPIGGF
ncbi:MULTISPECIES: hypothetical protein [Burkholderia]|uniref:5-formyltetrahydrofolate cyclo-ligase n=1 Tax=Burkholderia aenigmatica TaxID=2015348 RepID=A0A228II70_9BURK|nr:MULTISPECIES: hypothetical protein [Burkholderia]KER72701.1 hypothetical protein HR51_08820 [Burkholderia cepacia]MBN3844680.1 hypothetical protein [Burkholderia sp. Ac-20349]OXI42097.1 hypothetical protein CFB84_22900 [Burkholderia aenigmatica]